MRFCTQMITNFLPAFEAGDEQRITGEKPHENISQYF